MADRLLAILAAALVLLVLAFILVPTIASHMTHA